MGTTVSQRVKGNKEMGLSCLRHLVMKITSKRLWYLRGEIGKYRGTFCPSPKSSAGHSLYRCRISLSLKFGMLLVLREYLKRRMDSLINIVSKINK